MPRAKGPNIPGGWEGPVRGIRMRRTVAEHALLCRKTRARALEVGTSSRAVACQPCVAGGAGLFCLHREARLYNML